MKMCHKVCNFAVSPISYLPINNHKPGNNSTLCSITGMPQVTSQSKLVIIANSYCFTYLDQGDLYQRVSVMINASILEFGGQHLKLQLQLKVEIYS